MARLLKLEITNFKCFGNTTIEFDPNTNVNIIIAPNMAGKTTLLKAIRHILGSFLREISDLAIKKELYFFGSEDFRVNLKIGKKEEMLELSAWLTDSENRVTNIWRNIKGTSRWKSADAIRLLNSIFFNENVILAWPVFLFVGTEYLFLESVKLEPWERNGQRSQGYWYCLNGSNSDNYVSDWLIEMYHLNKQALGSEVTAGYVGNSPAKTVWLFEKALAIVLPEIVEVERFTEKTKKKGPFVVAKPKLLFSLETGEKVDYKMLSDGYKYLVLLVAEITTRIILMNGHLSKNEIINTPGIILIDEFGVHLHPKIQAESLKRLSKAFPKLQFIVTTHSNMLLVGQKKESIFILENTDGEIKVTKPEKDIIGLDSDEVLTEIFGLETTWDAETNAMVKKYQELVLKQRIGSISNDERDELGKMSPEIAGLGYDPRMSDKDYILFKKYLNQFTLKRQSSISKDELEKLLEKTFNP